MAKRLKFDESGDSDDLQALFDSIAGAPAAAAPAPSPHLEVVPSPAAAPAAPVIEYRRRREELIEQAS